MRVFGMSSGSGTPPTFVADTIGTIWSPCPPRTTAVTSFTDTSSSCEMNAAKRAVSRIPAMPTTRRFLKRDAAFATWHIASSGFETTTSDRAREISCTASFVTVETIASFVATRSSRLMPGERGLPAVITTTSDPAVSSYPFVPDHRRLVAEHRGGLVDVEGLSLREVRDDVDEHDVGVVAPRELLRAGRADVPGSDDRDFLSHP